MERPNIPSPTESDSEKLTRKTKQTPFVPIGVAAMFAMVGWGAYTYKNRAPEVSTSMFLMKLRVKAQSMVVGAMMLGVGYTIIKDYGLASAKKNETDQKGNNGPH